MYIYIYIPPRLICPEVTFAFMSLSFVLYFSFSKSASCLYFCLWISSSLFHLSASAYFIYIYINNRYLYI